MLRPSSEHLPDEDWTSMVCFYEIDIKVKALKFMNMPDEEEKTDRRFEQTRASRKIAKTETLEWMCQYFNLELQILEQITT